MDSSQAPDDQQLALFQLKTEEELWGAAWYWIWLSRQRVNPKG